RDAGVTAPVLAAALLRTPAEIVVPGSLERSGELMTRLQATGATLTFFDAAGFTSRSAAGDLIAQFGAAGVAASGIDGMTIGLDAAATALAYVRATQGDALGHVSRPQRLAAADAMTLDETAVRTLELLETSDGGARGSLFD